MSGHNHDRYADCDLCRNDLDFELPEELWRSFRDGSVVIFAGAGISTESSDIFGYTFYDEINDELPVKDQGQAFPDAMQSFEARYSRTDLLRRLKQRFDYAYSFPELLGRVSEFHTELGTIPSVRDIITTNYDLFFEEYAAATPIVEPTDYAFWGLPNRRVVKIHGSMSNLGSLVLTRDDYKRCYKRLRRGIIGSTLAHSLATRPVLFAGYALRDEDFNSIYKLLKSELGDIVPKTYIVNLADEDPPAIASGATVIRTDGSHFLRFVKDRLADEGLMVPDSSFDHLHELFQRVTNANIEMYDEFTLKEAPLIVYAACYQNGIQHAVQRMFARLGSGECSSRGLSALRIERYLNAAKYHRRGRRYTDAAYCEGYADGLIYPLLETKRDRNLVPNFFAFGADNLRTMSQFRSALRKGESLHKGAWRAAKRLADSAADGLVFRHEVFVDVP